VCSKKEIFVGNGRIEEKWVKNEESVKIEAE